MSGPTLWRMAWRNLGRNRRRTAVTLAGIVFGLMLAVLFTGLGDASYSDMIDFVARQAGGHVTLQHPEYLETPSLKRTVTDVEALTRRAQADPAVLRVTTRITGQAMVATAAESTGTMFLALDPASEDPDTLAILDDLAEGELFARKDRGIVLGSLLAKNLGAKLGRKVVYTMTDKGGDIVSGLARVTGLVETGVDEIDGALCLLPIDTVRELLGYGPDEATLVALFLRDNRDTLSVARRLGDSLGAGVAAATWMETQPELDAFITMKVNGNLFLEMIILLLVAAGIFNTLFVSVMERLREFGILLAIGFSPGQLFRLVMWESLWVGLVGLVVGAAVTAVPYYFLHTDGLDLSAMTGQGGTAVAGAVMDPILYVSIYAENAAKIAAAVLAATLLSGVYPAWRAGRVVPVETIKLV